MMTIMIMTIMMIIIDYVIVYFSLAMPPVPRRFLRLCPGTSLCHETVSRSTMSENMSLPIPDILQ